MHTDCPATSRGRGEPFEKAPVSNEEMGDSKAVRCAEARVGRGTWPSKRPEMWRERSAWRPGEMPSGNEREGGVAPWEAGPLKPRRPDPWGRVLRSAVTHSFSSRGDRCLRPKQGTLQRPWLLAGSGGLAVERMSVISTLWTTSKIRSRRSQIRWSDTLYGSVRTSRTRFGMP